MPDVYDLYNAYVHVNGKYVMLGNSKSGTGGTNNYNQLQNKPQINDIELVGNKSSEDLNIESSSLTEEQMEILNDIFEEV